VYTLVIAVAFPGDRRVLGVLSVGAIALFGMYALSVVTTLSAAAILRRTVLRGKTPALLLELPPYRMPVARNVLLAIWQRTATFVTNAGTVILAITIVLWALLAFPRDGSIDERFDEQVAQVDGSLSAEAHDERVAEIEAHRAEEQLAVSIAGRLGRAFEPVIAPLGYDWKIGVGLIASFAAREVLVSTLGLVYGVGGSADETSTPLREQLRQATRPDGSLVFTPLTGLSLMIFFVLAAQCMSTLAVVRRESGSWGWALFMLVYMNVLAYGAAFLVYQGGRLLGFA
jgi:ferrous iron transport protein B